MSYACSTVSFSRQQTCTTDFKFTHEMSEIIGTKQSVTQAVFVGDAWSKKMRNTSMRRKMCRNVKDFRGNYVA